MLEDKYARHPATWLTSRADNPACAVFLTYGEGLPNVREQRMGAVLVCIRDSRPLSFEVQEVEWNIRESKNNHNNPN